MMQDVRAWLYTISAGAVICGIVSVLVPSESYRRVMNTVLGLFMLCCFIIPTGLSFQKLDIDTGFAEKLRGDIAGETGDYFLGRGIDLSRENIEEQAAKLLDEYGIKRGEFEIYIYTDEAASGRDIVAEISLPSQARARHTEIQRVLQYELGITVLLEYREE